MKQSLIDRILANQTSIARKVYDCVPITEPWNVGQICGEMKRNNHLADHRRILGCLASLKVANVIREPQTGIFVRTIGSGTTPKQRVQIAKKQEKLPTTQQEKLMTATQSKKAPREPIEIVGNVTTKMFELVTEMNNLAEEFEIAALELTEYIEQGKADLQEIKELQRLLTKFGANK